MDSEAADELLYTLEEEFAAPMENAWTMLNKAVKRPGVLISTGTSSIDALIGGGVFSGEITEVFGTFTTGKSQLAMSLALQAVILPSTSSKSLGRVWYLDSSSNFSPIRLAQMFEHRLSFQDANKDSNQRLEGVMKVLDQIQIFDVSNAFQVLNILSQLNILLYEAHYNHPDTNPHLVPAGTLPAVDGLSLVVIDALGLLLAPLVNMKHKFGRVIMMEIVRLMRTIATTYNIAFVVTNHSSSDWSQKDQPQQQNFTNSYEAHSSLGGGQSSAARGKQNANGGQQAALGKYWSYAPSVQIMLRYPPQDSILVKGGRVAELRKSPRAQTGPLARANFTITNKGVDEPLGG
jgi:RecA/RadA recombinase